jgi:short subunit dehydrogenase-like uncharacterized protein
MPGNIVLLGATGYTGRLVARSLVERGARPLLAGRSAERLGALATRLGGLPTALADVGRPESLRGLLGEQDVLVTTVGPFMARGDPALDAAIGAGATYLDSTGEAPFIYRVFREAGPRAEGRCGLLTAFGFDYVPGNLAGALALRRAGPAATRVDVGYFLTGHARLGAWSTGTVASAPAMMLEPNHVWRAGRIQRERVARRVHTFRERGRRRQALSIGGSEHFALPRLAPQLREVNVGLGWFGSLARLLQVGSAASAALTRVPGLPAGQRRLTGLLAARTGGGPGQESLTRMRSRFVAVARDASGRELASARLDGPDAYTFTGAILAWGALQAAEHGVKGTGALGPVEAFGLDALKAGCVEAGLSRGGDGP